MFARCSGEPTLLDAEFVVGRPAPVLLHAEVCQSHRVALGDGHRCCHSADSIRLGVAPVSFVGLASNIVFCVIFFGVTPLCCYSLWRRHTQKT